MSGELPTVAPITLREVTVLGCTQWVAAGVGLWLITALTGAVSAAVPALIVLGTAAAWTALRGQRRGWLTPVQVRAVSRNIALGHGLFSLLGVGAAAVLRPGWFEGAVPLATTIACGLLASMAGAGLTLCGINLVNESWGSFDDRGASR